MRNPNKANWNQETWEQYINEASETAGNLEKLGANSIVGRWKQVTIDRENEYKKFVKPSIPYQN